MSLDFAARDYILNHRDFLQQGDAEIAAICLSYLSFDDFASAVCKTEKSLDNRLQKYPFLDYAALHWGDHVRSGNKDEMIQNMAFGFLTDHAKVASAYQVLAASKRDYDGFIQWPQSLDSGVHLAAYFGLNRVIELFRDDGIDLEVKDENGQTPLSWAVDREHLETIQIFLDWRSHRQKENLHHPRPPLQWAVEKGNYDMTQLFISYRYGIEVQNDKAQTSLWLAAENGFEAIVKLLIDFGAECDAKDNQGQTALSHAAAHGHEAVVRLLLERYDVMADSVDENSRTPLSWAAGNGHTEVVKLLLGSGKVAPDSEDADGLTPMLWAAAGENGAVIELLDRKWGENGADVGLKIHAPRKWEISQKVWMPVSEKERYSFPMSVEDFKYNEERGGWDYMLRDDINNKIHGWVKEPDIKKANM